MRISRLRQLRTLLPTSLSLTSQLVNEIKPQEHDESEKRSILALPLPQPPRRPLTLRSDVSRDHPRGLDIVCRSLSISKSIALSRNVVSRKTAAMSASLTPNDDSLIASLGRVSPNPFSSSLSWFADLEMIQKLRYTSKRQLVQRSLAPTTCFTILSVTRTTGQPSALGIIQPAVGD